MNKIAIRRGMTCGWDAYQVLNKHISKYGEYDGKRVDARWTEIAWAALRLPVAIIAGELAMIPHGRVLYGTAGKPAR